MTFLPTTEASAYLKARGVDLKPNTLTKMRALGTGPKYVKDGGRGVKYRTEDLDAFIESRLSPPAASTAEHRRMADHE